VEMTGDFSLTLPVMLAVAIASTISRGLSYGTIYTTKLLRRGTDIDRTTPWRALADLKIADAMRPFRRPLPVPPLAPADADGGNPAPDLAALPGPVICQADPQALFATESVAQALRQLEVYGHDGMPVLSADGRQIPGWVTAPDVLRAIARQIAAQAQISAGSDHTGPGTLPRHPPTPLHGYRFAEIAVTVGSPAAGCKLADITWPPGSTPVIVLRGRQLRPPQPELTLAPGDRVSLLTATPGGSPERDVGSEHHAQPAADGAGVPGPRLSAAPGGAGRRVG
jgi:chloride channel protein, CIC family